MFTYLGGKAGTSPGEILKVIDGASEGWANFKLSLPQISALSTTLVSLTGSSEAAGSALNNMFQSLSKAQVIGDSTNKVLYSLGLTAEALRGKVEKNPQEALNLLFDKLKGLEGGARTKAITALFGKGTAKPIGLLIEHLDEYKEMQKDLGTDVYEGKREKEYNKVVGELGSKFQLLSNSLKDLMQSITITIFPILVPVVDKFKEWTDAITEFVNRHPTFVGAITSIIGSILGLRVIKFGGEYIFHLPTGWIPGVKKAWKGFKYWVAEKLNGGVLGSIMTGGALFGKKVTKSSIGKMLFRALGFSVKGFSWIWLLADAALMILENWEPIKKFFLNIWKDVEPYWETLCNKLKGWGSDIVKVWSDVKWLFGSAWDEIVSGGKKAASAVTSPNSILGRGVQAVSDWLEGLKTPAARKLNTMPMVKPIGSNVKGNQNIDKSVTFNIYGANNPRETADVVWDYMRRRDQQELYDNPMVTV